MKVLVACEESQAVCKAFRAQGHEAYSCDVLECSGGHPEWHIQDDVLKVIRKRNKWDLMIGFPPCTYLSYAATAYWNEEGRDFKRLDAMRFFLQLAHAPIDKIALENPMGVPHTVYRPADQIIQPWYFGDPHSKRTCLWLKNLSPLSYNLKADLFSEATSVDKPEPIYIDKSTGKKRYITDSLNGKNKSERSKTFPGIARAMAMQWGAL